LNPFVQQLHQGKRTTDLSAELLTATPVISAQIMDERNQMLSLILYSLYLTLNSPDLVKKKISPRMEIRNLSLYRREKELSN
jgi:hypothetical protein